jgi:hypothetical protein
MAGGAVGEPVPVLSIFPYVLSVDSRTSGKVSERTTGQGRRGNHASCEANLLPAAGSALCSFDVIQAERAPFYFSTQLLEKLTMRTEQFDRLYNSVPDAYGGVTLSLRQPIQTRDARTVGPAVPLFGPNDSIRLSSARERGQTRDEGETSGRLEGNDPQKRISRGLLNTAESIEPIRDSLADAVEALDPSKNLTAGVFHQAQDIGELKKALGLADEVIALGHTYKALATDALTRTRAARDQSKFTPHTQLSELERTHLPSDSPIMRSIYPAAGAKDQGAACDVPPEPGSFGKSTKDAVRRSMGRLRSYLPGTNRGITTQAYQDKLRDERAKMATKDQQAAPVATARMTAADFAALRANKRQERT